MRILSEVIRCLSCVTLDKLSPYPDKTEIPKLSLQTYISEGFTILVLLLDNLVLEIDLDIFTLLAVFYMSVLLLDPDLSDDLPLSYLFLLYVSTVLLDFLISLFS